MKKVVFIISLVSMIFILSTTGFAYHYLDGEVYEYVNLSDTSVYISGYVNWVFDSYYPKPDCTSFVSWLEYWEEGSEEIHEVGRYENWYGGGSHLSAYLEDLKPSTTYYYRTSADKSNTMSFTTLPYPQPKTITTFEKTNNGYRFNVNSQSLNGFGKVYIALYKDDEFVGIKSRNFSCYDTKYDITLDFDYAKVMVWNKDTMEPVTTPEIVYNTTEN